MIGDYLKLKDGSVAAIIGGGPAGTSCAIKLHNEAKKSGMDLKIIIFEGKDFCSIFNQCMGVLSPPFLSILKNELGMEIPKRLIKNLITKYRLFVSNKNILLKDEHSDELTTVVRRVEFDNFMLNHAKSLGIEIIPARTTFVEFIKTANKDEVRIFSETGCHTADVVIGAFGLDEAMLGVFEKVIPGPKKYQRPNRSFRTYVTKVVAEQSFIDSVLGDVIYAFIPSKIPNIEFGALVPKDNYILINTAGKNVTSPDMDAFLQQDQVKKLLPKNFQFEKLNIFQGKFPTSIAKNPYGDRYVFVGDSTGWMRPFKGKGINTAFITGISSAKTMLRHGISRNDFTHYEKECYMLREDFIIGNFVRYFTHYASKLNIFDFIVDLANIDPVIKKGLLDSVSGHESYRTITRKIMNRDTIINTAIFVYNLIFRKKGIQQTHVD